MFVVVNGNQFTKMPLKATG